MTDGTPGDHTEAFSREAFMVAIVKLADDEAFRREFLTHYQLWLHPPVMVDPSLRGITWNMNPGGIVYLSEEQAEAVRHGGIKTYDLGNGAMTVVKLDELRADTRSKIELIFEDNADAP